MAKRHFLFAFFFFIACSGAVRIAAQQADPNNTVFHVAVNMVQLEVAVTDSKGNYVTGLRPSDFAIFEDGITEKIATFGEEKEAPQAVTDLAAGKNTLKAADSYAPPDPQGLNESPGGFPKVAGASVFILFDTSNYMYRGFVYAQDAIAEFIRSLDHPDRVAFYSYSRDFSRSALLTSNQAQVLRGVRATVAGDDAALYDCLLLTLKDAATITGRKVVVVFSNGPDNSSMVSPEDVRELAQSEGIPIYMICTREAKIEPISTAVFERMTASTGGKAYFSKNWKDEQKAFASIRDDLAHLYTLSYYPQHNPNRGWRTITVKLVGEPLKGNHIRTRSGYRPITAQHADQAATAP
ncbi:MAG TPA: VWA domain-containing protein [Terriglobia bacterium]|nr:VWA domain-containing protein [Terriglobia bacterium]